MIYGIVGFSFLNRYAGKNNCFFSNDRLTPIDSILINFDKSSAVHAFQCNLPKTFAGIRKSFEERTETYANLCETATSEYKTKTNRMKIRTFINS